MTAAAALCLLTQTQLAYAERLFNSIPLDATWEHRFDKEKPIDSFRVGGKYRSAPFGRYTGFNVSVQILDREAQLWKAFSRADLIADLEFICRKLNITVKENEA